MNVGTNLTNHQKEVLANKTIEKVLTRIEFIIPSIRSIVCKIELSNTLLKEGNSKSPCFYNQYDNVIKVAESLLYREDVFAEYVCIGIGYFLHRNYLNNKNLHLSCTYIAGVSDQFANTLYYLIKGVQNEDTFKVYSALRTKGLARNL